MNDEGYLPCSGCKMPLSAGLYSSNVEQTPCETKESPTKKIRANNSVSGVYVSEKGETTNKERYQSILKCHLLPFIDTQCCRDTQK